jgi:DNA-binding ferritin-like protein (Dps family)
MNFWETITGSDLTREYKAFDARAAVLPHEYRAAWEEIKGHLSPYTDFTGRNLMPILDGVLGLLEETASDSQSVRDALGGDIKGFCAAIAGEEGAKSYRDKWRDQLNKNVAKKLSRLGE